MTESLQKKIGRNRPPRVHITYDVETRGAMEKRELPFIVGVLAELSGDTPIGPERLKDRRFVEIDRDNFADVLKDIEPSVKVELPSPPSPPSEDANAPKTATKTITIGNMEDFAPFSVANQLEQEAYYNRAMLSDITAKLDGNPELFKILRRIVAPSQNGNPPQNGSPQLTGDVLKQLPAPAELDVRKPPNPELANEVKEVAKSIKLARRDEQLGHAQELFRVFAQQTPSLADAVAQEIPVGPANVELAAAMEGARKVAEDAKADDQLSDEGKKKLEDAKTVAEKAFNDAQTEEALDLVFLIKQAIAKLDQQIAETLNLAFHQEKFQALEATWRGLYQFVQGTETGKLLKIRILNVTKDELRKDLEKAIDFDQSALFKKVYEEEYGTLGGNPYSVLLGIYEFDRTVSDMSCLRLISDVAAAAHAPFISAAQAGLFDLDTFEDLGVPRDLSKVFESPEMIKWNSFRESEDSRYVTLVLPHYLLRLPYHKEKNPAEGVDFTEDAGEHKCYLWGNATYALGLRITNAFALYGWTAAIRGYEGGGRVEDLPIHTVTRNGADFVTPPTEVYITDRREKELSDLGFIALVYRKFSDKAVFFGGQTTNKAIKYFDPQANANARLSASLPYMMACSRFAHYIKVQIRDKVGLFMSRGNVEVFLRGWIANYVLLNDEAPQSLKAENPLREARIDVFEVDGKPGVYRAVVFLRPHFQLEELTTSIRLVAELPPPVAA